MNLRRRIPFLLLACVAANAQADVSGQCRYHDHDLAFVDAHAALAPDPFDDSSKVPTLWFTTVALDHAALDQAKADAIDDAVTEQVFAHDSAELSLRLDADGKVVEGLQLFVPPGSNRSLSSNEVGKLTLKGPMTKRATGRFELSDDEDLSCNLQFDVPMAGKGARATPATTPPAAPPKPWGMALPAGGGEPGKAYLDLHRAALASDVDTLLRLSTKARADAMREARAKPEFAQMLDMIKTFEPAEVHIVSGRAEGDRAELQIAGKDSDGNAITGEVKLSREAGQWHIENVSTQSKVGP